jgi:hypothetical protein
MNAIRPHAMVGGANSVPSEASWLMGSQCGVGAVRVPGRHSAAWLALCFACFDKGMHAGGDKILVFCVAYMYLHMQGAQRLLLCPVHPRFNSQF